MQVNFRTLDIHAACIGGNLVRQAVGRAMLNENMASQTAHFEALESRGVAPGLLELTSNFYASCNQGRLCVISTYSTPNKATRQSGPVLRASSTSQSHSVCYITMQDPSGIAPMVTALLDTALQHLSDSAPALRPVDLNCFTCNAGGSMGSLLAII